MHTLIHSIGNCYYILIHFLIGCAMIGIRRLSISDWYKHMQVLSSNLLLIKNMYTDVQYCMCIIVCNIII